MVCIQGMTKHMLDIIIITIIIIINWICIQLHRSVSMFDCITRMNKTKPAHALAAASRRTSPMYEMGAGTYMHPQCPYLLIFYLFIYLVTGLLDNIRHCCPVDGPSQTP
jgi:hypothetical protein